MAVGTGVAVGVGVVVGVRVGVDVGRAGRRVGTGLRGSEVEGVGVTVADVAVEIKSMVAPPPDVRVGLGVDVTVAGGVGEKRAGPEREGLGVGVAVGVGVGVAVGVAGFPPQAARVITSTRSMANLTHSLPRALWPALRLGELAPPLSLSAGDICRWISAAYFSSIM